MTYTLLHPRSAVPQRNNTTALAVMAKAPRAGKVKTRLSPPLTMQQCAELNICFLRDTTRNIAEVALTSPSAGMVCYTPAGDEEAFDGLLPARFALICQRGSSFGERLLCAAQDILACGFGSVCLIDSDSPTLPASALAEAVRQLNEPGDRIVLGGSDDGGYYLIGLKQAHARVFEEIAWSTSRVYAETVERVHEIGAPLVELPLWYDVDDAETLDTVSNELLRNCPPPFAGTSGYDAHETRCFLAKLETQSHRERERAGDMQWA
ncbi:MAG: TIGR04282 family arsenosugar biosynthesis glycosyltransferase [Terracidiphilus sp.]|nr:TIGR04282 family arsenosugar biosynthesis glycosyltransferase [Terracidiphilus sp.]